MLTDKYVDENYKQYDLRVNRQNNPQANRQKTLRLIDKITLKLMGNLLARALLQITISAMQKMFIKRKAVKEVTLSFISRIFSL